VFADVSPETGCLDADAAERAVTEKTRAVLAVHVYGTPCDTEAIQSVADKHRLKVVYDAAHAFGVERDGESILNAGDISTLSFHATKAAFNTIEGGALVCKDAETKRRAELLKNFGFAGETEVLLAGINGKMDEVRASYGLLNLRGVDSGIAHRREAAEQYRAALSGVPGIRFFPDTGARGVRYNYSYVPVLVDGAEYGMSRDALYEALKARGVFCRRYFYPLVSRFPPYRSLPSAQPENLPAAEHLAASVLCLPMFTALTEGDIERTASAIKAARGGKTEGKTFVLSAEEAQG